MFASQLLRILQTIPSDVKNQTRVYDTVEQDMTMKENHNPILDNSESLGRKADPLAFGSKEIYQFNGLADDTHPSVFEVKSNDESWNPKFDDFSMSNQNGTTNSIGKEFQDGSMYCPSSSEEDSEDVLSSYTDVKEKVQSNPEHECSMSVVESMLYDDESKSQNFSATDLFETDTNPYSDKNVFESDPPEVMVCYKEINYHIVKDICVDEGMNVNSKVSISGCEAEKEAVDLDFFISGGLAASSLENTSGLSDTKNGRKDEMDGKLLDPIRSKSSSESSSDRDAFKHCDPGDSMQKGEAVDLELLVSDGLVASSLGHTRDVSDDENGSKDEGDGKLVDPVRAKSSSESSYDRHCDPWGSVQKGETKFGEIGKTVKDASEEDSFIDRTLPIQEFGTRSFLRSFLNSLDREENKVAKFPDQENSPVETLSEGPTASPAKAGPKEDIQASSLFYNSKVENGTITFNFNSLSPMANGATNGSTQNAPDSRSILVHKDADADDLSDASRVNRNSCSSSSKDSNSEKANEQSLKAQDDELPAINDEKNVHNKSLYHIDEKSNDLSSDGLLQFPISKSQNCTNSDSGYGSSSVVGPRKYDEGEVSFSAAGLITYSGPVAYSGSLSDGSATSSRSFAFPVLQPEWSSSPESIPKGDEGHFRKHKGWKSGLLCCRFRKDSISY